MSDEFEAVAAKTARIRRRGKNAKQNGKLPSWIPGEDDSAARFALWLNEIWGLEERDPFVSGERYGKHGDAAIVLVRQSGQRIRWTHQTTLQKPGGLQGVLISECGIRPKHFSVNDAMLIAWAITRLADLRADLDPLDEAVVWWQRYVDTRPIVTGDPADDRGWRVLLHRWQQARQHDEIRSPTSPRETFIVIGARDGVRYVRREDYAEHARSMVRGGLSWPTLNSRLAEVGWRQARFQKRATAAGAPYVEARLYVVPANWPETEAPTDAGS